MSLPVSLPFAVPALRRYLAVRAIPGAEVVTGDRYQRIVTGDGEPFVLSVDFADATRGRVTVQVPQNQAQALGSLCERVTGLVDANADVAAVVSTLSADPLLRPLVRRQPGLRIPGCFDGFELATRAVLGQQVSVSRAVALAEALARRFGVSHASRRETLHQSFPTAEALADAPVEVVGVPRARADAIRTLARRSLTGELDLRPGSHGARDDLLAIRGIGPWTANYIALRALRDPDAFPSNDLGLRQSVGGRNGPVTARELAERALGWAPVRGYAAAYLWDRLIEVEAD